MENQIVQLEGQMGIEEFIGVQAQEEIEDKYSIKDEFDTWYHFERIKKKQDRIKELKDMKERGIEKIINWFNSQVKECEELIDLSKFRLETYYKEQREKDNKFKLVTPHGTLYKTVKKDLKVVDEEAVIKYLKANDPELINIKESINKKEFKAKYKAGISMETGEIVEGVEIQETETMAYKLK